MKEGDMEQPEEKHLQRLLEELEKLEKAPRAQLQQQLSAHFARKGQQTPTPCDQEDFAAYFLSALRHHTRKYFYSRSAKAASTPIKLPRTTPSDAPREPDEQLSLNESLANISNSSVGSSISTPGRQPPQGRRGTPASEGGHFCSTPQSGGRNRSTGGAAGHSYCLGDFLVNTPNQGQQRSKKKTTPHQIQGNPPAQGSGSAATPQSKPRRRVLPMTISKNVSANSSFGDTSSFSNENNLLRLSQSSEIFDRSQGAALDMEARKSLLLNKQEIKIEAPVNVSQQEQRTLEENLPSLEALSLDDVKETKQLQLLSNVYSLLLDLNLVPNVLSELSFAVQLLSISDSAQSPEESGKSLVWERLSDYKSCVYFAAKLLENQQNMLLQLDKKTLGVLLQNERISLLPPNMLQQLEAACQQKQELSRGDISTTSLPQQNVYYHEEKDSRDNFPTQYDFGAFKTQRDLFYRIFKQWELSHLNRVFNFTAELCPKIQEIFRASDNPVNMAHLAKLFVSQLLISASETTESPEELGLKTDPLKLNRLAQRLVTSNSSVEGQFPRAQAFFRDFIAGCSSLPFLYQLKIALYVQLLRHNDSTFELIQLSEEVGAEETSAQQGLYVVRVQTMANMLILAKFLGFVHVLPFSGSTPNAAQSQPLLCPKQLQLRSQLQPEFHLREVLERSMRQGKLLVTLPWLVQYLVMLDLISLQLPDAAATLDLLYGLYASVKADQMHSGVVFIVRSCIGWLMDAQPQLVTSYYSQRKTEQGDSVAAETIENCLIGLRSQENSSAPLLEELLPVACPFLQEFRVSITASKQAKSGRFRYITTRLEQMNTSIAKDTSLAAPCELTVAEQQQRKLADAFLHSQNASTRRLIEFVTERSFKCVVKDAQQEILLPSKASADAKVNEITSVDQEEVRQQVQKIFQQAREQACIHWKNKVPQMLDQRIRASLEALLPASTNNVLRSTYSHLIRGQVQTQLHQWLQSNVLQSSFYHGDLRELSTKVCNSNRNKADSTANGGGSSELQLTPDMGCSLSELLFQLQQWLHCLSLHPEGVGSQNELFALLRESHKATLRPQLPTVFYHLIGSGLVHLLQLLITRRPQFVTPDLISASCNIWSSPQFLASKASPGIFEGLLSVSFIVELGNNPYGFPILQQLLEFMLKTGTIQANQLNEYFMAIFRENWPINVWNILSNMLQSLSLSGRAEGKGQGAATSSDESPEKEAKSHLFMEMLADLSRDLDSF